jgi:hypothetical protein
MYMDAAVQVDRQEEMFWHQHADIPDLDTSRVAVRRAMEQVIVRSIISVSLGVMAAEATPGATLQ